MLICTMFNIQCLFYAVKSYNFVYNSNTLILYNKYIHYIDIIKNCNLYYVKLIILHKTNVIKIIFKSNLFRVDVLFFKSCNYNYFQFLNILFDNNDELLIYYV